MLLFLSAFLSTAAPVAGVDPIDAACERERDAVAMQRCADVSDVRAAAVPDAHGVVVVREPLK